MMGVADILSLLDGAALKTSWGPGSGLSPG